MLYRLRGLSRGWGPGLALAALLLAGCSSEPAAVEEASAVPDAAACPSPVGATEPTPPPDPACGNDALTSYDELLVVAPHPDDETLGFGGLITAYLEQGKPVGVIVTTDGDAYCDACALWKSGSVFGATCNAEDLSNFATEAVDSFGEVRHTESQAAMQILGAPAPTFLRYPDTGLAAAWAHYGDGEMDVKLRRSDFSKCESCGNCGGYGEGPEIELTAATLVDSLTERIAATSQHALIATTHWLDGHGDHSALGNFVRTINGTLDAPRATAFAVIHAHTPKDTPAPDCWYPGPPALSCPCFDESCASADPGWIAALRKYRYRPDWPGALPDDADYGAATHLCLAESMYQGAGATKLAAINSYASQLGFAAREGELPPGIGGMQDCNGYLTSFVKRTEAFVYVP
jgi:LmbE family N-acetylglucosaminyl deacetylase